VPSTKDDEKKLQTKSILLPSATGFIEHTQGDPSAKYEFQCELEGVFSRAVRTLSKDQCSAKGMGAGASATARPAKTLKAKAEEMRTIEVYALFGNRLAILNAHASWTATMVETILKDYLKPGENIAQLLISTYGDRVQSDNVIFECTQTVEEAGLGKGSGTFLQALVVESIGHTAPKRSRKHSQQSGHRGVATGPPAAKVTPASPPTESKPRTNTRQLPLESLAERFAMTMMAAVMRGNLRMSLLFLLNVSLMRK